MELKDIFIGPAYFFIIYFLGNQIKNRVCKEKHLRKYFMNALLLKLFGAVMVGIIYQFYYRGGDTFSYFVYGSKYIFNAFTENPYYGLRMIFAPIGHHYAETFNHSIKMLYFNDSHSFFVIRVSALLGLFTFHSYSANAMLFAVVSFSGCWVMYITFYKMFPKLHKELAWAILFIPSVIFWGSGLLKDSLTLGATGWLFYTFREIFIEKKKQPLLIFMLIFSAWIIQMIKVYIIMCIVPCLIIWLFLRFNDKIKSATTRMLLKPFLLAAGIGGGLLAGDKIAEENTKYKLDNIAVTAQRTSEWLKIVSEREGGSGYDLGEMDGTLPGMIKMFPQAVNVSLFRPYLWEVRNPLMLLSALESTIFLYYTILTLYTIGLSKSWQLIRNNHELFFCIVFSLIFAFAVGISTNNFGSLVRYKIPLMPFYAAALVLMKNYADFIKRKRRMAFA